PGQRPRPDRLRARPPGRRPPGHPGRRRRARLLPVVAVGQLRVGPRLQQAVRRGLRRLPDRHPHPQGQRPLVRGGGPHRRPARRLTRPGAAPFRRPARCRTAGPPPLPEDPGAGAVRRRHPAPLGVGFGVPPARTSVSRGVPWETAASVESWSAPSSPPLVTVIAFAPTWTAATSSVSVTGSPSLVPFTDTVSPCRASPSPGSVRSTTCTVRSPWSP